MSILVLQHADCEPPGVFSEVFDERQLTTQTVRPDRGEKLPTLDGVDGLIAMGGPMSVTDAERIRWLAKEIGFVRLAVEAGVPVLGICLGAQILAASLGARVYVGRRPEVGVAEVRLTTDGQLDELLSVLPATIDALHWHSDTFELPIGAAHLAESSNYRHQAFRWGNAYGLQFHLEATEELCMQWSSIAEYAASAREALGDAAVEQVDRAMHARASELNHNARLLISRWLDVQLI